MTGLAPRPSATDLTDAHLTTATLFAHVARRLATEQSVAGVLDKLVLAALECVPGASHVGVAACTRTSVRTLARNHPVVEELDDVQRSNRRGPTWEVERSGAGAIVVANYATEQRWGKFGTAAVERGIHSSVSVALEGVTPVVGTLTVYASEPQTFCEQALALTRLLAVHASIAVEHANSRTNLNRALESRDHIGQAKGILVERYKITEEMAFDVLARCSQRQHLKLAEVAEHLCLTGNLPT